MEKDTHIESLQKALDLLAARMDRALLDDGALAEIRRTIRDLLIEHPDAAESVSLLLDQSLAAEKIDLRSHSLIYATLEDLVSEAAADDTSTVGELFGATTVIASPDVEAQAQSRAQVGSILRDRFVLRERVADGFLGTVFKAQDRNLASEGGVLTWVAVKVMRPDVAQNAEALRILQQEAAKSRYLVHDGIVRFIDLDREDDILFTVADWIDGKTLAKTLAEQGGEPMPVAAALEIVRPIASALDYAHRCGVIHGDVKPDTVMITTEGRPMLFDFGLARLRYLYNKPGRMSLGKAATSNASMQILTGDPPDVRDDVFSLACLFYRLVSGHRVFGPRNAAQAAEDAMQPQKPPGMANAQWEGLSAALAFARVTRPGSVAELMQAIDPPSESGSTRSLEKRDGSGAQRESVPEAQSAGFGSEQVPRRKISKQFWAVAAVVILVLVVGWLRPWGVPKEGIVAPVSEPSGATAGQAAGQQSDPGPAIAVTPAAVISGQENDAVQENIEDDALSAGSDTPVSTMDNGVDIAGATAADPLPSVTSPGTEAADARIEIVEMAPASLIIPIERDPGSSVSLGLTLREDQPAAVIEITRSQGLDEKLSLKLEEVSFTGNRSPLLDGQYLLLNDGVIEFEPGQSRKRLHIVMRNDASRESDRRVVLALVDMEAPDRVYGRLSVALEDDDQRRFEAGLPQDTITFSVSQVASREQLPAVQLEVLRLNAGQDEFTTSFAFIDQTATEGQDYFVPTQKSILFQPGQRSTRLFIPLVQDSEYEGDETFVLELESSAGQEMPGVNQRIVVLIRDDDQPAEAEKLDSGDAANADDQAAEDVQ